MNSFASNLILQGLEQSRPNSRGVCGKRGVQDFCHRARELVIAVEKVAALVCSNVRMVKTSTNADGIDG
jgi:hypothetical protein